MSVGGIFGYGNPSSDALLTTFAFAHAMILAIVIIIGRNMAFCWGLLVLVALFYNMFNLGWDYEYHYLTPIEAKLYKEALLKGDPKALEREAVLENHNLKPTPATRYFRLWFTFITVSLLLAYTFGGILTKTFNVIPVVINNIELAIQNSLRTESELEQQQKENTKAATRVNRYIQILDQLNKEVDKLDYGDKKKIVGVINVVRKALSKEADWKVLEANFDSVNSRFFQFIKVRHPELTDGEINHLSLIRMGLLNSDIARLMDVKLESLRVSRAKLKKKLNIPGEIQLKDFVNGLTS